MGTFIFLSRNHRQNKNKSTREKFEKSPLF